MTEIIALTPVDYILVLPFIFLAGLIDSIAGGGGLISLPAYVAAGLPMHTALATNKFSSACGTIFSTARYLQAKMIDLPVALVSAVLALFGSYLGTRAVLLLSGDFLRWLLLVVIPIIAVFTLIRKNFGHQDNSSQFKLGLRLFLGGLAGLLIGFWDGFFWTGDRYLPYSGVRAAAALRFRGGQWQYQSCKSSLEPCSAYHLSDCREGVFLHRCSRRGFWHCRKHDWLQTGGP